MGTIRDAANVVYANGSTSAPQEPDKAGIRSLFGTVEDAIDAATAGVVRAETWTALAAISGTRNGQPGQVPSQAGTHTDPVTGATVANQGEYRWVSGGGGGWRWVGAILDATALQAQIDAEATARVKGDIRRLTVGGTANAITGTVTGAISAYDLFLLSPNAGNNTDAVTLNINGTGAFPLVDAAGQPLRADALVNGRAYIFRASGSPVDGYRLITQPQDPLLTAISALSATAGSLPADQTGYAFLFNPTTFTFSAVLADDIGGKPLLNRFDEPATVGTSLTEIVREGSGVREIVFANKSETATINIVTDQQTLPLGPGAIASLDGLPPGKTFASASEAAAPLFCRIGTKATSSPNAILRAERLVKRHSAYRDIPLAKRLAWQDFYFALDAADVLRKSLYLFVMNTYDLEAAMLDWGPHGGVGVAMNAPSFTPYTGPYFNGSTQHVLTGRKWSDHPSINATNLAMMVFVGSTVNGATRAAISSGDCEIQPNNTSSSHRFINSSTAPDPVSGVSIGGMLRTERTSEPTYTAHRNRQDLLAEFTRTARETLFDYPHVIAAHTGSTGPSDSSRFWNGTIKLAWAGEPLTQAQWDVVYNAFGTFTAAMEAA